MMDIDKAFDEFIEFPEGSSGNLVTTVSAKLFAKHCVERLQEEVERLRARLSAGVEPRPNITRPRSGASQAAQWFAYCPDGGFEFYSTEAEALEAGDRIIHGFLNDCWAEEVSDVFVGKAAHRTAQVDRVERPDLVDEDGNGSDGRYWADEWSYICNYELQPIQQDIKEQADAS